jgi:hypothetical protein
MNNASDASLVVRASSFTVVLKLRIPPSGLAWPRKSVPVIQETHGEASTDDSDGSNIRKYITLMLLYHCQ